MNAKFPKLIALDLDETLLDPQSRLPAENRRALYCAAERGCILVAASGRAFDTLPEEIRDFPGMTYAICGNGAEIRRLPQGDILRRLTLSERAVEQVLAISLGENLTYEAFLQGKAYGQADYIQNPARYLTDDQTVRYVQATRIPVPDIADFLREQAGSLESLALVVGDLETKSRMMAALHALPEFYVTTSVPRLVEISHPEGGKHRGLQYLCESLGIPREATLAFGNGDNDAEMLSWAGVGVAVGNGSPACLRAADYVTDAFDRMGVARALHGLYNL